jgi:hypothetical protein
MSTMSSTLKRLAMTSVVAAGLSMALAPDAFAVTNGTITPTSGTQATGYTLNDGALSCPTATNQPNGDILESFVVDNSLFPAANLASMTYKSGVWTLGSNSGNGVLYTASDGTPYTDKPTTSASTGPGPFPTTAAGPFSYAPFLANDNYGTTQAQANTEVDSLYPGTWNLGVACVLTSGTNAGQVDAGNLFYIQETITDTSPANTTADNSPNASQRTFNWSTTPSSQAPEVPYAILLPLGGAAVLAGGALLLRRRHRHTAIA